MEPKLPNETRRIAAPVTSSVHSNTRSKSDSGSEKLLESPSTRASVASTNSANQLRASRNRDLNGSLMLYLVSYYSAPFRVFFFVNFQVLLKITLALVWC